MRHRRVLLAAAFLLAAGAREAAAQDSFFGIRGLGFPGRPVSARSAGMGGGEEMFDGSSALSPASLAAWHGLAAWAVGAQSGHSYDAGTGQVSGSSMRFPTFGFAVPISGRIVIGVDVSDYLNRNWNVQQTDTVMPRDSAIPVTDRTVSIGGVSDIRFAAAYRISGRIAVGVGLHVLSGSVQTGVERDFGLDSVYRTFAQVTETDYRGVGVSFGLFVNPIQRVVLGASARFNGRLWESNPVSSTRVHLPTELGGGLYVSPFDGVTVATTFTHDNWSVAAPDLVALGQAPSRDVWSVGVGAEVALVKLFGQVTPLRAGYRWRQLPFPVGTDALSETAFSAGLSFTLAGGRANLDLGMEGGSRTAGALKESFTTLLVGISIFP
jgi:hypothetical protein